MVRNWNLCTGVPREACALLVEAMKERWKHNHEITSIYPNLPPEYRRVVPGKYPISQLPIKLQQKNRTPRRLFSVLAGHHEGGKVGLGLCIDLLPLISMQYQDVEQY